MKEVKPYYSSKTLLGAAVFLVSQGLFMMGVELPSESVQLIAESGINLIAGGLFIWGQVSPGRAPISIPFIRPAGKTGE